MPKILVVLLALAVVGCGPDAAPGGPNCVAPLTTCNGDTTCHDLQSDPANCGSCGNACGTGLVCSAGACVSSCAAGTTDCSGACVDLSKSASNCGTCGNACSVAHGTAACTNGTCG